MGRGRNIPPGDNRSMLKKFLCLLVLASACCAMADETTSSSDAKTQALYVHPIMLIGTASIPGVPLWVFLTYEKELSGGTSFAIQPDLWVGSLGTGSDQLDLLEFGIKGSYRKYLNGHKSEGVYIAPSLEYAHASVSNSDGKGTINIFGVLGYIGYRAKWEGATLFTDIGLGRNFVSISADDGVDAESASGNGLGYGFDLGIGIPF